MIRDGESNRNGYLQPFPAEEKTITKIEALNEKFKYSWRGSRSQLDRIENKEAADPDKKKGATEAAQQQMPDDGEDVHDCNPPEAQG